MKTQKSKHEEKKSVQLKLRNLEKYIKIAKEQKA
jgi:hypothetical protein